MSRLKKRYLEELKNELQKKFEFTNPMMIPVVKKIVINMGIAEASKDKNSIQDCISELSQLSGQKPIITKSRKAMRGIRMYEFMDRFFNLACPRIRDFRGFPSKCDGRGNYSLGLEDQQVFPDVNIDAVKRAQGMHITFVTSAKNDEECVELLRLLGLPFKNLPITVAA